MISFIVSAIEDMDDRDFMESLYYSYKRLMYSEIRKIVHDTWDVEDVLQNTLIRLIKKIPAGMSARIAATIEPAAVAYTRVSQ